MKKLKLLLLSSLFIFSSCSLLVKEADIRDHEASLKVSKEVVGTNKLKDYKIKNIAIFGFNSSVFAGDNSSSNFMGVDTGLINMATDAASGRGCIALDKTHKYALRVLKEYGFNILPEEELQKSKTYASMGSKDFPSLCTSGSTRINLLAPVKEMNKLFDELNVDALLSFTVAAQAEESSNANIYVWVKGKNEAELVWMGYLKRQIKVEENNNIFFKDLEELSQTKEQKVTLTAKVFMTSFKVLIAKMFEDLK